MQRWLIRFFLVGLLALCSAGCVTNRGVKAPTVFMIGDSTMADKPLFPAQPERGWGQLLPLYFQDQVQVVNLSRNGRSSKSFWDEGRWQPVRDHLKRGDYVIIQFGHNDEKSKDPKRFTEPFGSFTTNLVRYVSETRELGGHPVLATSIVRRKFNDQGALLDTHGDYIVAARQVAVEEHVPLLDLERDTAALIGRLGPEQSKKLYMWCEPGEFASIPTGRHDDTHLNAFGACRICDLATKEMREAVPELAAWLRTGH